MTLEYGKFEIPTSITVDEENTEKNFARFVAEPFEKGFGHTLGNTLRRLLYTSIEAPAVIGVAIEGVLHEFTAVEGFIEDMTTICLNLKQALLRRLPLSEDSASRQQRVVSKKIEITQEMLDEKSGLYPVTLGMVVDHALYEVVNPELVLFTVTKPVSTRVDLRVAIGRGYVPSERHIILDRGSHEVLIDGCFTPIRNVAYKVENTRVGQDTDFDKLVIDVTTDGRITPKEALSFSSQIASRHFDVYSDLSQYRIEFDKEEEDNTGNDDLLLEKLCMSIDEMELSVRSTNCLRGANIETIAELVSIPDKKMLEFKNFGKKSLTEIKAKLTELGLHLGMDLSRFSITQDNVKERMRQYQEERRNNEDLQDHPEDEDLEEEELIEEE